MLAAEGITEAPLNREELRAALQTLHALILPAS